MKKTFIQIRQWILGHRKRLIYAALALLIFQIGFFDLGGIGIENNVFAEDNGNTATQNVDFNSKAAEKFQEFSFIQKMIYLLIYPMLVIAGSLVDNSLVYGEIFGFDVALWELWNIMRNLANFTLGFIFVYQIFRYLLPGKKKEDIKKLLISLLIAGLGIQASWFIMAALIDVSTILAYGIGGLPISVLKDTSTEKKDKNEDDFKNNPYILKTVIDADVNHIDVANIYLTNTPGESIYISECETFTFDKKDLLLAPKMIYFKKSGNKQNPQSTFIKTEPKKCHYGGQVYQFSANSCTFEGCSTDEDCKTAQTNYQNCLKDKKSNLLNNRTGIILEISNAELLEQGNAHVTGGTRGGLWNGRYDSKERGLDVNNEIVGKASGSKRLNDILDGKSYVGIFTQLYSSLMRTGQGIISSAGGNFEALLSMAISLGHLIAIAIPLIVVGIVFMIRIGILWVAIVISPFIALFTAFEDLGKELREKVKFLEYFTLENLIGIIFAPAIICLAISLSAVLITIITNLDYQRDGGANEIRGGLIHLDVAGVSAVIQRFLISIFGIAATRFLVWAAVESSKLGKMGFVQSLKKLAETSIGSIPIVPIPGKKGEGVEFIGANTAFGLNGQKGILTTISDKIQTEFNTKDSEAIEEFINGGKASQEAVGKRASSYTTKLLELPADKIGPTRMKQEIMIGEEGNEKGYTFTSLDDGQKKKVIEGINAISDVKKRQAFGQAGPIEIEEGGKKVKYNFIEKDKDDKPVYKYQSEGS